MTERKTSELQGHIWPLLGKEGFSKSPEINIRSYTNSVNTFGTFTIIFRRQFSFHGGRLW